jgi:hypothetical protein
MRAADETGRDRSRNQGVQERRCVALGVMEMIETIFLILTLAGSEPVAF